MIKKLTLVFLVVLLVFPILLNSITKDLKQINEKNRREIVKTIINEFNKYYVFPEIAKKYEVHLNKKLNSGGYKKITNLSNFVDVLTSDMLSIYPDGHLAIFECPEKGTFGRGGKVTEEWWEGYKKKQSYDNYGFYKVERLPGNIGFLDLRSIAYPFLCYETAVAAMKFLSNTDAVIIDLRNNPGGRTEMAQLLISYFFEDHRTHYSTEINRLKGTKRQWWTLAEVPGKRMPKVPLFILTSLDTGSGAETVTYALKHTGRAVIIGQRTAGANHKTHDHSFPNLGIAMAIPDGHSISPITGKNWEGTGVIPHFKVDPKEAFDVAYSKAINTLIKTKKDKYSQIKLNWIKEELVARNNPVELSKKRLKQYVGEYGKRKVFFKKDTLFYQREGRSLRKLLPMSRDLFSIEGFKDFRIAFVRNKKGEVIQLNGLFNSGTIRSYDKTR